MRTPKLDTGIPLAWGTAAPDVVIVLAISGGEYVTGIHDPQARALVREHHHEHLFAAHSDFQDRLERGY